MCLNDVIKFNFKTHQWKKEISGSGLNFPEARRNHAATIIGKHMFITGGLNG